MLFCLTSYRLRPCKLAQDNYLIVLLVFFFTKQTTVTTKLQLVGNLDFLSQEHVNKFSGKSGSNHTVQILSAVYITLPVDVKQDKMSVSRYRKPNDSSFTQSMNPQPITI